MRRLASSIALLTLSSCGPDPSVSSGQAYDQCMTRNAASWSRLSPEVRSDMCSGEAQSVTWNAEEQQHNRTAAALAVIGAAAAVGAGSAAAARPPTVVTTTCNRLGNTVSCTSY